MDISRLLLRSIAKVISEILARSHVTLCVKFRKHVQEINCVREKKTAVKQSIIARF